MSECVKCQKLQQENAQLKLENKILSDRISVLEGQSKDPEALVALKEDNEQAPLLTPNDGPPCNGILVVPSVSDQDPLRHDDNEVKLGEGSTQAPPIEGFVGNPASGSDNNRDGGQKAMRKREISPTAGSSKPKRQTTDRRDEKAQDYDNGHSDFKLYEGFKHVQLRANSSQDNVNVTVNKIVLKIGDSHGRSCLCCSLMFLAAVKLKRVQRFNSKYLDTVLMRGLALDRDLRLPVKPRLNDHLYIGDLKYLGGSFLFDDKTIKFKTAEIGWGSAAGNPIQRLLETLKEGGQMLLIMNRRWVAAYKKADQYFLFNCHPTQKNASYDPFSVEPAAIFVTKSSMDAEAILKNFCCAEFSPYGEFEAYSVTITIAETPQN